MIGAHAAILGVAAFEGSVRSILINLDQLANRTNRLAQSQQHDFDAAAKATENAMARQAHAVEATSKAVAAAKDYEAKRVKAANDAIIASDAARIAHSEQLDAHAARQAAIAATPARSPARQALMAGPVANADLSARVATQYAIEMERAAAASAKAADKAQDFANKAVAGANAASAAAASVPPHVDNIGKSFTAASAISTAAMFAIIAAITLMVAALIGFGVASVKAGADYSQAMSTTQALTSVTAEKMQQLDSVIRHIGTTTLTSMTDAAKATTELAKGGVSIDAAMQGALKSVVNLSAASAGELSLAEASKAMANSIAAFNIASNDTIRIADAITGVAQNTTATYNDLAHSMSQVGTVANSLNFSIEDTTRAIGLMALSAIKGSDAGTSLRAMLQHLEHPTKAAREAMNKYNVSLYDSNGAARPLRDVIINLESAFGAQAIAAKKLTQEQRDLALVTLFGSDGQRAALALINQGVAGYDKLAAAQRNVTAEDIAGKMLIPLNAQLAILGNNVNAATIAIGQSWEPVLQKATQAGIAWLQSINQDTTAIQLFGNTVSALATGEGLESVYIQLHNVFGPNTGNMIIEIINLFRNIGASIDTYIKPALDSLGQTIAAAFPTADIDTFAGAMGNAAVAVNIIAAYIGFAISKVTEFVSFVSQLPPVLQVAGATAIAAFSPIGPVLGGVLAVFLLMPAAVTGVIDALISMTPIADAIGQGFSRIGMLVNNVFSTVGSTVGGVFDFIGTKARGFFDALGSTINTIVTTVNPISVALFAILAPIAILMQVVPAIGPAFENAADAGSKAFDNLGSTVDKVVKGFGDSFSSAGDVVNQSLGGIGDSLGKFFASIGEQIASADATMKAPWIALWNGLIEITTGAVSGILTFLGNFGANVAQSIVEADKVARAPWIGMWEAFQGILAGGLTAIFGMLGFLAPQVGESVVQADATGRAPWIGMWEGFQDILIRALTALGGLLNAGFNAMVSGVAKFGADMGVSFASAGNTIGDVWARMWNGLISVLSRALSFLAEKLNGFFEALKASPIGVFVEGAIGNFQQFAEGAGVAFDQLGTNVEAGVNAVHEGVNRIQGDIQAQLTALRASLGSFSTPFEGITPRGAPAFGGFPGVGGLGGTPSSGSAGPSTAPSPPEVGGGADKKSAAEKAAEEAQKRLKELYEDTMRQLANLTEDTLAKIDAAWEKHTEAWAEEVKANAEKIIDINEKRDEALANAAEEFNGGKERRVIKEALELQIEDQRRARDRMYEDQDRASSRALEDVRRGRSEERELKLDAYEQELDDQNRASKRMLDAQEAGIKRSNQAAAEGLREQQQIQSRALSEMFEAANAARQSMYSDEDAQRANARAQASASRGYNRSLMGAKTPEERANVQAQYQQQLQDMAISQSEAAQDRAIAKARKAQDDAAKKQQQAAEDALKKSQAGAQRGLSQGQEDADTARKIAQEDKDLERQRTQARAIKKYKKELDDAERKEQRDEEDKQVLAKRARDDVERGLKKAEDQILRDLEDAWALEDYNKKIKKINDLADKDLEKQAETHAKKLAKIDETLLKELEKVEDGYEKQKRTIIQKWDDAWKELIEKSPEIEAELAGLFADFSSNVAATDKLIKDLIADLKTAIELQNQVATGGTPQPQPTATPNAQPQSNNGTPPPPSATDPKPGFGSAVKPEPTPALGFTPTPSQYIPPAAVGNGANQFPPGLSASLDSGAQQQFMSQFMPVAAQILAINAVGSGYTPPLPAAQTTNITYSVAANYSDTQSPASVAMDMQALATMTRR